jgi:hypothetical protein
MLRGALMEVRYQCNLADFLEGTAHQPKPFMWYVNWAGGILFLLAAVVTTIAVNFFLSV